jgi:8-oxo-dGTP pyrophosphatase MutT (NUDIX family)
MPISEYLKSLRTKIGHAPILMPSVCVLIFNDRGHILLQQQKTDSLWHTVGGSMDPHEEPAAAAIREAKEETGLDVIPARVVSVYTGPNVTYPNGDVVWYVTIAFACTLSGNQQPHIADDESLALKFFPPNQLPPLSAQDRRAIEEALKNDPTARFYL